MRAAILDDLSQCREYLRNCLSDYLNEHYTGEMPVVEEFTCGEDFLSGFKPETWDIIFIDQYMPGLSGIETAREIRKKDKLVPLLFVTTSQCHAIECYGVRARGYLVKPYDYAAFEQTMVLTGLTKIRAARFIRIEQEKILLREIIWCERTEHYIQIHTDRRGILRFRLPFGELVKLLAPFDQFLTCYRGCIINAERTEGIEGFDFLMDTGEKIPYAPREKKNLETMFSAYLFQREREEVLL